MILASLTAALLLAAFPGFGFSFTAWFAFVPLFAAYAGGKKLFLKSYICGFLFYAAGFYWLRFISILAPPFVAVVFACYFLIMPLGLVLTRGNLYCLPFAWTIIESLQELLPAVGVPWFHLSFTQVDSPLVQVADIGGAKIVSFFIVFVNAVFADLVINGLSRRLKLLALLGLIIYSLGMLYGSYIPGAVALHRGPNTIVVQGNIPQEVKERTYAEEKNQARQIADKYISLTTANSGGAELIIWPETTLISQMGTFECANQAHVDRVGLQGMKAMSDIASRLPAAHFVAGVQHFRCLSAGSDESHSEYATRNSVYHFSYELLKSGQVCSYSKRVLVPFGEYFPIVDSVPFLKNILLAVTNLTSISAFEPGKSPEIFDVRLRDGSSVKFGPLVCFEIVFPALIGEYKSMGADAILNCSNEAWYRDSYELDQLLAIARVRAIEHRISIVRAVNSGISCVINPLGEATVLKDADGKMKEVEGVLKQELLYTKYKGLYSHTGDVIIWVCVAVVVIMAAKSTLTSGSKRSEKKV